VTVSSDFDLQAFHDKGVVVVRDLFTANERAELAQQWQEFQQWLDTNGRNHSDNLLEVIESPPNQLGQLFHNPKLVALAKLVYGEDIAIYLQRFLLKDKSYRGSAWLHHDAPYSRGSFDKMSLFICLGEANEKNGGLIFYEESHKLGFLGPSGYTRDSIGSVNLEKFAEVPFRKVCPPLSCGDLVACHYLTWHYSEASQNEVDRPMVQVIYQPASDGSGTGLVAGRWRTPIGLRENYENKLYVARYDEK
jgi:hypothetical protein